MTCKECIHQTACLDWCRGFGQEAELCEHFSDKAERGGKTPQKGK